VRTGHAKATLQLIGLSLSILGALGNASALAVQVTYKFTSTVSSISPSASGFPASLNGVSVNDPISGSIQYDAASPSAPNTQGGVFQLATYYPLTHVSVSINVDGVVFNTWDGQISAFVWNDDPTSPPGTYDGLLFVNITSPTNARFKVGNTILPSSTFSNESLPGGPLTGFHIAELGTPNSVWLDSGLFNLTQVSSVAGDYDGNGIVNLQDYQAWKAHFGAGNNLAIDGNGNNVIDAADYVIWRNSFGHGAGNGAIVNDAAPEPATVGLLLTAAIATLNFRFERTSMRHSACS
jgi:hypothetical protein